MKKLTVKPKTIDIVYLPVSGMYGKKEYMWMKIMSFITHHIKPIIYKMGRVFKSIKPKMSRVFKSIKSLLSRARLKCIGAWLWISDKDRWKDKDSKRRILSRFIVYLPMQVAKHPKATLITIGVILALCIMIPMGILFGIGLYMIISTLYSGISSIVSWISMFATEYTATTITVLILAVIAWGGRNPTFQ